MRKIFFVAVIAAFLCVSAISVTYAEDDVPSASRIPTLAKMQDELGAHIEYVGRRFGMDMWIAAQGERVQILYSTADGRAVIVNNMMYGPDGELVTERDISDYFKSRPSVVEKLQSDIVESRKRAAERQIIPDTNGVAAKLTKAQRLMLAMAGANNFAVGSSNAPTLLSFVDPYCSHCNQMWEQLATAYVGAGRLRLILIPVAILGNESLDAAAQILASNDPIAKWLEHHRSPLTPSLAIPEDGRKKVQENLEIMQDFGIDVTPFSAYVSADGEIKILAGIPQDIEGMLADMAGAEENSQGDGTATE